MEEFNGILGKINYNYESEYTLVPTTVAEWRASKYIPLVRRLQNKVSCWFRPLEDHLAQTIDGAFKVHQVHILHFTNHFQKLVSCFSAIRNIWMYFEIKLFLKDIISQNSQQETIWWDIYKLAVIRINFDQNLLERRYNPDNI